MNLSNAIRFASILAAAAATAGVIDDAKFKLDLRDDTTNVGYIDAGEVGNAFDYSAASPDSVVYGGGNGRSSISATQYATSGYATYGTLPYVSSVSVVNPYDGSTTTRPCLILPQEKKTENDKTYWAENGIALPASAVPFGADDHVTIYARFKWEGNTYSPNHLVGNGWDGTWGNADHGFSVFLDGEGKVGILNYGKMGSSTVKSAANVWCDLFVITHNETIGGAEKGVSDIYLYKANAGLPPTLLTGSYTGNVVTCSSSKKRLTIGSYLLNSTGWHNISNPRAFKGSVADVMIWDRAVTRDEMAEVMADSKLGGEWQIGALNGNADEFGDGNPAALYDVQAMPWNRMRKTLDASNASLSIATTMTSSEHQKSRMLSFTPILTGATAPVAVFLNGTAVGEIDLASTTSITLPKELWRHDGTANTITVTRTAAASGTIQFDAISLAPAPTATAVLDDAIFKLDLRGGTSTYTQPGDLGNAFDFSSASPLAGYMGDQRGPQTYNANYGNLPAQETAAVTNPYYPTTTNTQNVLHFYQDQKSATASVRSSIVIPGAAPQGPVQTFYLRFRWDGETPASTYSPVYVMQSGNAVNGWSEKGVAICFDSISGRGTATTNAVISYKASNDGSKFNNLSITAGEWNDLFVTFAQNAGNTSCAITASLCKTPSKRDANGFNPPSLTSQSATVNKAIVFDTANLTLGGYHDSYAGATTTRAFRGLIADFMVWDRALTDNEKIEVMAGQHGAKWRVGAINGSADEFTDTDPAAVFEPQTMPWRQMRKTLDASHPTLTLKSPLATFEAGKPMILHVDPLFTGTPTSVPVTVSVNGTQIGSFDLAQNRNFIIDRQYWQRDGSGNVTVALTRTETTGTVAIDALSLSGSWQITDADGGSNGMLREVYAAQRAFAGDCDAHHFTSSLSVGASHTNYTFGVWVPAGMGELCGWKFRTKTTGTVSDPNSLDEQHTVYVNGVAVATHEGRFGTYEPFTAIIPAGTLHDGMNYVQWVQTLPARADQQALDGKPGMFQYYDFWGMTLIPPPKAFIMIVR